jgi:hypothetical protein
MVIFLFVVGPRLREASAQLAVALAEAAHPHDLPALASLAPVAIGDSLLRQRSVCVSQRPTLTVDDYEDISTYPLTVIVTR